MHYFFSLFLVTSQSVFISDTVDKNEIHLDTLEFPNGLSIFTTNIHLFDLIYCAVTLGCRFNLSITSKVFSCSKCTFWYMFGNKRFIGKGRFNNWTPTVKSWYYFFFGWQQKWRSKWLFSVFSKVILCHFSYLL